MRLNSGSDAIELEASHFESSNDVSTPFTLSFWFTSDTADNHLKTLMTNGIEGGGRLDAVLQEDSLTLKLDSSVYRIPVRDHSWNHFVMVVAPSEGAKKVYMNGEEVVLDDESSLPMLGAANLHLGAKADGTGFWTGALDDIAVWDRALTFGEASRLHMSEAATYQHTPDTDDYGKSDITLIVNDLNSVAPSRFDNRTRKFERNIISISHNPTRTLAARTPTPSTTAIVPPSTRTVSTPYFSAPDNTVWCEYKNLADTHWLPGDTISTRSAP